jgi:spore coat protein H
MGFGSGALGSRVAGALMLAVGCSGAYIEPPPDAGAQVPIALYATMAPADLAHLYERPASSDELMPVELALADASGRQAIIPEVRGVRFRGRSSRAFPRKSYHIRLDQRPELDDFATFNFRSDTRRAGDRLLLLSTWADPSGIRVALAFAMYAEIGLPAPSTYFVDWWLNGVYEGLYVAVERIDREALHGWGLERSHGGFTLVRDRTVEHPHLPALDGASTIFAVDPEGAGADDEARIALLQQAFDHRGELESQDWEALLDLWRWVHRTEAGPGWAKGLEERFDVDALLDVLAVMQLQHDFDSFYDDYWLYRDHDGDGRWRIIPWDKTLTFGNSWPLAEN